MKGVTNELPINDKGEGEGEGEERDLTRWWESSGLPNLPHSVSPVQGRRRRKIHHHKHQAVR